MFSKFIWFWQARRYAQTHIIVSDDTCGFLKVRADKFVPEAAIENVRYLLPDYLPTESLFQ